MSDLNPSLQEQPPARLSIWRDMWLKPRAVLRQECTGPSHWRHWAPALVAGVVAVLEAFVMLAAQSQTVPSTPGVPPLVLPTGGVLLLTAALLGPLFGMIYVGVIGFLLRQVGRLFGGVTTPDAMRRGVSLSLVPLASAIILLLFEMWWRQQHGSNVLLMISTTLRILLNYWHMLLLAMCVSELQVLSLRRAIATVAGVIVLMMVLPLLLRL